MRILQLTGRSFYHRSRKEDMPAYQKHGSYFLVLTVFLLIHVISACNFSPRSDTPVPGMIDTAAAQTIQVNMQQLTIEALQIQLTSQAQTLSAPTSTTAPPQAPAAR